MITETLNTHLSKDIWRMCHNRDSHILVILYSWVKTDHTFVNVKYYFKYTYEANYTMKNDIDCDFLEIHSSDFF